MGKNRKRRRKNKSKVDLPENLAAPSEFEGLPDPGDDYKDMGMDPPGMGFDPVDMMGSADDEDDNTPLIEDTRTLEDVMPESFVSTDGFVDSDVQQYKFTLAVNQINIKVSQHGVMRTPDVEFSCRISAIKYSLSKNKEGIKRPDLAYVPLTLEEFKITLPAFMLPGEFQKNPDTLSPKVAADVLMAMFNQMPWEQIRPGPKPDHERVIPENIMKMMGVPIKGGS